jgi:hypothetical protein
MRRSIVALALVCLLPASGRALEIVNLRPCYGPTGAAVPNAAKLAKVLSGDRVFLEYTIAGLKVDDKTSKASFQSTLTLTDSKGKPIFTNKGDPIVTILDFGGTSVASAAVLRIEQPPGLYKINLTVKDVSTKQETSITYPVEVIPADFGFVTVDSVAAVFPGEKYIFACGLANYKLVKKDCNLEITVRVLDASDKPVGQSVVISYPRDLPAGFDQEKNFLPVVPPVFVANRPGRFTFDIVAVDKNNKGRQIQMRLPLTVLDIGTVSGK